MLEQLKIGDTVQIRSGGPVMTVMEINKPDLQPYAGKTYAKCIWWTGTEYKDATFQIELLELVEQP